MLFNTNSLSEIHATACLKDLSLPGKTLVLNAMYRIPLPKLETVSTPGTLDNWSKRFLLTPSGLRTKSTSPFWNAR